MLRRRSLLCAGTAALLLSACAQAPRSTSGVPGYWSGRIALLVEDASAQSFHASFELQGTPEHGELLLFTPLGSTIARLEWSPSRATLIQGQERRESASLEALTRELTGSELPIPALFGWLRGEAVQVAGWQADLSALADGRITATRHMPTPQAVLRILLNV